MATFQHVPPPRRKSCNACVKAKRRCDLLTPQCTRCSQKKIECVYGGQAPRRRTPSRFTQSATTALATTGDTLPITSLSPLDELAPVVLSLPSFDFDAMSFEMPIDSNADLGFASFVPTFPVPPFPADYPTPASLTVPSETSGEIYTDEDYKEVEDICDDYNSDVLNDDTSRVACAVAAIRNWHRSMAFSYGTPFLHRKLYMYSRPKLITDVFTSCLMYATKTPRTEDVILPLIENNASALIIEYSRSDITPTMALARAQALLLYQSMREAHYVDRDLPILQNWIGYLSNLRDRSRDSFDAIVPSGPDKWDSWIFWESVSRTVLAASFFINVHCLIAKGEHPLGEWTKPHLWTASKQLWSAETSQDFFALWQRRSPLLVCNIFIKTLMDKGDSDEVDAFASMLMVPCLGLEGTKRWINDTKGRLEELPDERE